MDGHGETIKLTAADGHRLAAYRAVPAGQPIGGLVMIQEIFGLTAQMQRCADRYAAAGYLVVLPAMFDRKERGVALGYTEFQRGGGLAMSIPEEQVLADVEAARLAAAEGGVTAIVGFCWGGTVAYLAAAKLPFACAVSYYGGGVAKLTERMRPAIPVQYHFGARDAFIPAAAIDRVRAVDATGEVYVYEGADHGFGCDDRASFHAAATQLAEERTLAFFSNHL